MADHNVNVNFVGGSSFNGGDSSNNFFISILNKLNATIDKLSNSINAVKTENLGKTIYDQPKRNTFKNVGDGFNNAINEFNENFKQTSKRNLETLTSTVIGTVGITALRLLNNEAQAIMSRATAQGGLIGATILGNANQVATNSLGNFFDIERQRQTSQNSTIAQSVGGGLGALLGIRFGLKGMTAGAVAGAGVGDYLSAKYFNQDTERDMLRKKAISQQNLLASQSEYTTGFSRFGVSTQLSNIASSDITGGANVYAPISQRFKGMYGNSQNYNAILSNIVPFLQNSPLNKNKTGDLNQTAQNFIKAGFDINDFSKLTVQSTQYQALTGKNLQKFSEDLIKARIKFGNAFDLNTMQNSLNLMSLGKSSNEANKIAFQSQYNPSIMQGINQYMNQAPSQFYANKVIGNRYGIDINKTLNSGEFTGSMESRKELQKELRDYKSGKNYGNILTVLNAIGFSPQMIQGWLQPRIRLAETKDLKNEAELSPMQKLAATISGMDVTATNVTINASNVKGLDLDKAMQDGRSSAQWSAPSAYSASNMPAMTSPK